MYRTALKMLVGDRAKYAGILIGLTFAALLVTQQAAIFIGLMTRTHGFLTDTALPDIWVVDENVQHIDDIKPLLDTELYRVRGVPGVAWAVPMYKGTLKARLQSGNTQVCWVVGLDDATLIGGPPKLIAGSLSDLRENDAVIVDMTEAKDKLVKPNPNGKGEIPIEVGDILEINDHRARVVGLAENSRTFQSYPLIYTTYTRALSFAPKERKLLSYILVKAGPGVNLDELAQRITEMTGLQALPREAFIQKTYDYYMEHTGIPVNFGLAVALGFIVGTVIAGQTFYNFTLDNLRFFGTFKAMGASNGLILRMIFLQALSVGALGYGLGVGLAALFGLLLKTTVLSFKISWWLPLATAGALLLICLLAALLSARKVLQLEPAIVFRSAE